VPLIVVYLSFAVGLIGIGGLWSEIKLEVGLSATFVTAVVALFMVQSIYEGRHSLRENDLLMQCRGTGRGRALKIQVSTQLKALLIPAVIAGLVLLLAYTLVQSNMVWGLSKWVFFEDRDEPEAKPEKEQAEGEEPDPLDELKGRIKRASPLVSLSTYVGLSLGLVYYFSMRAARQYAGYMNQHLPPPIFLQGEKLAQVVRQEAEVELGRLIPGSTNISLMGYLQFRGQNLLGFLSGVDMSSVTQSSLPPQVEIWGHADNWMWDELERTSTGGLMMKVARAELYKLPQNTAEGNHIPHPRVSYLVEADPWGRVIKIEREKIEY
jgi:hypothetical protein